ncbi:MAG: phenylalanine--tRNA ligase subunit alpha [bacterium]|nr:phenylalanine--tRNA ligase subunit alpha [bacterium]
MLTQLQSILSAFELALSQAQDSKAIEALKVRFLGKKGEVQELMAGLKSLSNEEKAAAGKGINELKQQIAQGLEARTEAIKDAEAARLVEDQWIDISLNPEGREAGSLHPITLVHQRLEEIFEAMGYSILDGPHVETDYYNFEALNFDPHHPARDMHDTFFFKSGHLLRTQTSPVQIHGMEQMKPPLRIVSTGKVFRCERLDATHEACFHQIEGMMIDKGINVGHLIHSMKVMLSEVFEREVEVRLRPGYFPFVEPGFELEIACLICGGDGCPACKKLGWVELLGCGMVHPNVLKAGGIDPEVYSGFAFGMGTDRLAMQRYGISDIRHLHNGDLSFNRRFSTASGYRVF